MGSYPMTYPTAAVLIAIRSGYRYGFDIMDATGLPDGTVYPILRRLERRGFLTASWEEAAIAHRENRPARRYYGLTAEGVATVQLATGRFPGLERMVATHGDDLDPRLA